MEKLILLFASLAHADEVAEKPVIMNQENAQKAIDFITAIPKLGTVGIIAGIVLALVGFAIWYWKNDIANKATQRDTEKQRAEDQAKTVTDNQDQSKEYQDAQDKLAKQRQEGITDETKPDIPDES